jgi:hypothetical protein
MIQQVRDSEAGKFDQLQEHQQIPPGYEQRVVIENGQEQVYLVPIEQIEQQPIVIPSDPIVNYDEQGNQILTFNTQEDYDRFMIEQ